MESNGSKLVQHGDKPGGQPDLMARSKKPPTAAEIALAEKHQAQQRRFRALITSAKKVCQTKGLRVMEFQYEYLQSHPDTALPDKEVSWKDTCECYQVAIRQHKDDLVNQGGVKTFEDKEVQQ